MLEFGDLRAVFRIPWVRENRLAFRSLSHVLDLLLALHRSRRFREFARVRGLFFEMSHSLFCYDRERMEEVLPELLETRWFQEHRRALLEMIASHRRIVCRHGIPGSGPRIACSSAELAHDLEIFVRSVKECVRFDSADDDRVQRLVRDRAALDSELESLTAAVA